MDDRCADKWKLHSSASTLHFEILKLFRVWLTYGGFHTSKLNANGLSWCDDDKDKAEGCRRGFLEVSFGKNIFGEEVKLWKRSIRLE